ncbi:hypothetical protein [Streptomyces sp. NPDC001389]|uniref:hypothetical protein n=1 Tax=Streptomyces sp. NPDC001389 TaxID=3364569 RepID=UPI0036989A08
MTAKKVLVAHGTKHGATAGIAEQMQLLGAREHRTFGGSVTARAPRMPARSMLRQGKGGDVRDPERIRSWAHHNSAELAAA